MGTGSLLSEARPQEANVPDPPELPDPTSPPSDISEELNDRDSAESNVWNHTLCFCYD